MMLRCIVVVVVVVMSMVQPIGCHSIESIDGCVVCVVRVVSTHRTRGTRRQKLVDVDHLIGQTVLHVRVDDSIDWNALVVDVDLVLGSIVGEMNSISID